MTPVRGRNSTTSTAASFPRVSSGRLTSARQRSISRSVTGERCCMSRTCPSSTRSNSSLPTAHQASSTSARSGKPAANRFREEWVGRSRQRILVRSSARSRRRYPLECSRAARLGSSSNRTGPARLPVAMRRLERFGTVPFYNIGFVQSSTRCTRFCWVLPGSFFQVLQGSFDPLPR